MSGNKAVLDSNLLIFLSKGMIDLGKLRLKYDDLYVSIISYMEVYAYHFQDLTQKDVLDESFKSLKIIDINREVADQTIIFRKSNTKKIKLPDAVILASAKYINADLITNDYNDFQNIDSSVNVLNLDDFRI